MSDATKLKLIEEELVGLRGNTVVASLTAEEVLIGLGARLRIENGVLKGIGINAMRDEIGIAFSAGEHKSWEFAPVAVDGDDAALALTGNLTAAGRLYKQLGSEQFEVWKKENGFTPGKAAPVSDARKASASNCWSKSGWSLKAQGALIVSLGEAKASAIAAAAGCKIGSTKPNPLFN